MSDVTCLRTRKHRRAWERAIRRFAKRAARQAGADLLPLFVLLVAPGAFALPVGEQVQAGNVTINRPNPNAMTITQGSQKGIVNWNGFSIAGNERVDIAQPSAQAVLLNRVVGNEVSRIAGQLNANGHVFLVNPAGVVFARGASVNVGSLVASTLGISNAEFLAGKYHFSQGAAAGAGVAVESGATIAAAPGGAVALLGAQVDNSGHVSATLGKIALGSGSDITLDFAGDGLTMLKVNKDVANALVSNAGTLEADGGQIVMSVRAADAATASVLNQTGTVRARSVEARNGRIVLDGGSSGVTEIGGVIDATAPVAGTGGNIDVTGYHVAVNGGARIDASGANGGGRVRVGGGAAGKATDIANADALWMSPNAHVSADALVAGNGGNIVMYGTEAARVYGALSARGGPRGGNGGLVETSGEYLDTSGARIRLDAPKGRGGQWLLDPASIEIVNTVPSSVSTGNGDGTCCKLTALTTTLTPPLSTSTANTATFTPGAGDSYVLASDITSQLNQGASVTVSTSAADTRPGRGDISMDRDASITKTQGAQDATLTLSAAGSMTLSGAIGGPAGDTSPSGKLNVVLDANKSGAADGANAIVLSGATISTNGGALTIGVPAAAAGAPLNTSGFDGAAIGITGTTINTADGSITINGRGSLVVPTPQPDGANTTPGVFPRGQLAAVNIVNSSLATSLGAISIAGQTGGVAITGGATLSTGSGNISIRGAGNGLPGVEIQGDLAAGNARQVDIRANGGDIDIRGYTTNQSNDGVFFPGVQIGNASVTVQGNGHLLSITGDTASRAPGIALSNAVVSAGRDPATNPETADTGNTLVLRADNNGGGAPIDVTTVPIGSLSAATASLFAPAGSLVVVPGHLDPATLNLVADDAKAIDVGGTATTGFTIGPSVLGQISPDVSNVIVGSSTHTGRIVLNSARPLAGFQALTLANGGAGSQGIALPLGYSGGALTLQSAGTVTEGAGIQSTLSLVGPGVFQLTSAGNSGGFIGIGGTRDVQFTHAGNLRIGGPSGVTFDGVTGRVVSLAANGSTLSGSADIRTTDGGEGGPGDIFVQAPVVENAAGRSTLALHSNGVLHMQSDITATRGPLDIVADARTAIIAQGDASEVADARIRFATNGGNVTMGTLNGGASGFDGATLQIQSVDIDTRAGAAGGNVTLHGIAPALVSLGDGAAFPAAGTPYGVDLNDAKVFSGTGTIDVQGRSLNPSANPGGGVILRNAGNDASVNPGATQLVSNAGGNAVNVWGAGSGANNNGVAMLDNASIEARNGTVDIRGSATGANSNGYGALLGSGSIAAANVNVTGSTNSATAGVGIGMLSISGGASGNVWLRAANNGADSSFIARGAPSSISSQGGVLAISAASVDPSSFAITAQNGVPITLFGTNAMPGLVIDAASYRTFSPAFAALVLGSTAQTGRITVDGQGQTVATNLTLQNPGAGSAGIDLPSGLAMPGKTLALDSSGPVTDPGGIQAETLLLAGGGDFDLADAGNDVKVLALSGAHNVRFSSTGDFVIGTASANGIDGATGNLATIGGARAFVTGNLTAISDNGAIALGTPAAPTNLSAAGGIDLVMEHGVFDNAAGGTLDAGSAWRVWAATRTGENRNGIDPGGALPNFYGCLYGGLCSWNGQPSQNVVPANGNHFVYADRPTATVTLGNQTRGEGAQNGPFAFDIGGLLGGDRPASTIVLTNGPRSSATATSVAGAYSIDGAFTSPVGYEIVVVPGTLTVTPMQLQGAVFNRTGLQPLFTAQEQSFVYESNLGAVNICVGTNEPILALQQSEGEADTLAADWKRVRSRPNLNNCLVVNGQHGCGEF